MKSKKKRNANKVSNEKNTVKKKIVLSKKTKIIIIAAVVVLALAIGIISAVVGINKNKINKKVVGTVGEFEVQYEELRWMTLQYRDLIAATYGEDIWDDKEKTEKYIGELQDAVYSNIIANYAVLTLCDDDILKINGKNVIDINSEEIQDLVEKQIDKTIDDFGGKSEYKKNLKKNYLTDSLYRFMMGIDICENMLFKYYCSLKIIDDNDQTAVDYIYDNFIRTVHIYIQNDKNDSVEENRALANAIKVKLNNGEDMDDLMKKYSEDRFMTTSDGNYFPKGTHTKDYEKAAFALKEGEISDIVETPTGFFIIKRMPLDGQYIAKNFTKLKNQYLLAVFDKHIEECKSKLSFVPNDFGKSLDLSKIK